MKRTIPLICLALLALILAACGNEPATATGSQPPAQPKFNQPTPTPTPGHHQVGSTDTAQIGNHWKITVLSRRTSPGSGIVFPSSKDDQFLVISVKMVNISNETEEALGMSAFRLRDPDGTEMSMAAFFVDDKQKPAPSGSVEAGQPVSGDLVYEVPKSVKKFTLLFDQYSYDTGPAIWDIIVP
jgi:hypothetical protein